MDAAGGRFKAFQVFGLATHADGEQGAAVEGVLERNDLVFFRTVVFPGVATGQFEGSFVGFSAGVCKEHPLGEGEVTQGFGQPQGRLVGHDVRQVPDFF